jgi:hypothetical protein
MNFHLAQINIARLIALLGDPRIAGFVSQLDPINAIADSPPALSGGCNPKPATPPTSLTTPIPLSS